MSKAPSPETIIVLDTNVLLHFQPVGQWDWSKVASLPVRLLICAEVLRELDEIKDRGDSRSKKDRALAALKLAETAIEGPIPLRDGVSVRVEAFAPVAEAFAGGLLDNVPDDRILATALAEKGSGASVVFVSNDTTPRMRAKALGLKAVPPPDEYRLPEERDPRDEEKRQLKEQLEAIKRTIPRPKIRFKGGEQSIAVTVPNPEFLGDEPRAPSRALGAVQPFVRVPLSAHEEAQVDEYLRFRLLPSFTRTLRGVAILNSLGHPTPEQIEKFNLEVATFQQEYQGAYQLWQTYRDQMMSVLIFCLVLTNEGTAPTDSPEVRVWVAKEHLDHFEILTPNSVPRPPKMPVPPQPLDPVHNANFVDYSEFRQPDGDGSRVPVLDGTPTPSIPVFNPNSLLPNPRFVEYPDDQRIIRFGQQKKLRHGSRLEFGPFAVRRLHSTAQGCSLKYEIHADNLPEPICGELHLRFG